MGTVTVTVVDKDNKPVADATVRVVTPADKHHKHGEAKGEDKKPDADEKKPENQAKKPTTDMAAPIAEGKTGADGKVKLEKVPAGEYIVQANLKGAGRGVKNKVIVKANENTDVTVKLGETHSKKT